MIAQNARRRGSSASLSTWGSRHRAQADLRPRSCTDTYVRSKPKVVRTGKLIQQARCVVLSAVYFTLLTFPRARKMFGGGDSPAPIGAEAADSADEMDGLVESKPRDIMRPSEARLVTSELGLAISDREPRFGVRHCKRSLTPVITTQTSSRRIFRSSKANAMLWTGRRSAEIGTPPVATRTDSAHPMSASRSSFRCAPLSLALTLFAADRLTLLHSAQAWGARFSDHPLVLGQEGAKSLPKLDELRAHVGRDFTEVGNRREKFARAMVDRALKKIDEKGTLRKASAAGCSALLLIEFLLTCKLPCGS